MNYFTYLFVAITSMIVGVFASIDRGDGMGLVIFGCVACFIGATMLIVEESLK